jgi:hypothetical protein
MLDPQRLSEESIRVLREAQANPQQYADLLNKINPGFFGKAQNYNQAFGLVWYDLEPVAKLLYPVITPLRNMIPRVGANGGTAVHWKSITGINTNRLSPGVSEGNRTAKTTDTVVSMVANYAGLGFEQDVSFEADYAGMNFDDVKSLAVLNLLRSLMIAEEQVILLGDATFQLNANTATPTPTVAVSNFAGNLTANSVYYVGCVALTPNGYFNANANGIQQTSSRTSVSGDSETIKMGAGIPSASNSANCGGNTSLQLTVTAVKGAAAYAWYASAANAANANNATFIAMTTVPKYIFKGNESNGTQKFGSLDANDSSNDSLIFDGLWAQISGNYGGQASNAYYADLGGNNLTIPANGTASIAEIDTALKAFWDNYRISPDIIWMSSQEVVNINNKIVAGGGAPLFRFVTDVREGVATATAGLAIGQYLNKFSMSGGQLVAMRLHPNMPPGSLMFYSTKVPYPLSNVNNLLQMKMRRDYYQIEWPLVKRAYQYGVYEDGLLQNYFPPAYGLITGINNG